MLHIVKMTPPSPDTKTNQTSIVLMSLNVPLMLNVNGSAQSTIHTSVKNKTPVSQHKMTVVIPTLVKHLLHQNSKQKQTILSSSVALSTPPAHTSDTRSQKQEAPQLTPTSLHSTLSELPSSIQLHSTQVPTQSPVSTVLPPIPMTLFLTMV